MLALLRAIFCACNDLFAAEFKYSEYLVLSHYSRICEHYTVMASIDPFEQINICSISGSRGGAVVLRFNAGRQDLHLWRNIRKLTLSILYFNKYAFQ